MARNFSTARFKQFGRLIFRRRQKIFGEHFGRKFWFFVDLAWTSTSCGETDIKVIFCVKFRSRWTYPEVCTTKNHDVDDLRSEMGYGLVLILPCLVTLTDDSNPWAVVQCVDWLA